MCIVVFPTSFQATMIYCFQTQFNTLKNEHILIFAKHYLADHETATASKTEFNKYFPNQMSAQFPRGASLRLRLVKLTNSPPGSSELTLLGFDKSTESGIDFVKNMLEAEARHILKNAGSPKRKQFDVKVEELPISQFRNVPMAQSIPSQHDFKQDQIPRSSSNSNNNNITAPKTYHSFTILPKNRLSNVSVRQRRFRSQDEMPNGNFSMTSQRTSFQGQSPDVYIVDEKIATRCPSAEVASSFTSFQSQQTPVNSISSFFESFKASSFSNILKPPIPGNIILPLTFHKIHILLVESLPGNPPTLTPHLLRHSLRLPQSCNLNGKFKVVKISSMKSKAKLHCSKMNEIPPDVLPPKSLQLLRLLPASIKISLNQFGVRSDVKAVARSATGPRQSSATSPSTAIHILGHRSNAELRVPSANWMLLHRPSLQCLRLCFYLYIIIIGII